MPSRAFTHYFATIPILQNWKSKKLLMEISAGARATDRSWTQHSLSVREEDVASQLRMAETDVAWRMVIGLQGVARTVI